MNAPLIDSHCHLDFPELAGQLDSVFALMRENNVAQALCVSVTLEDFPRVHALAVAHEFLHASAGVHPDYADLPVVTEDDLLSRAALPKVVAIGETGLDYYRLTGDLEWQRERFRTHIRAARACGKPLIIHTRAAAEDTIRLMREEKAGEAGGVMHCFTESWDVAQAALDLGFHISFSGIVTFRNAKAVQAVAARVPLDRMLVETDAPYLAPVPHRGKLNQPGHVRHVARYLAELRGIPDDQMAAITTSNFHQLFKV